MFTCKKCNRQSEMFEVYKEVPQRWCIHCLQETYEVSSFAFTGHPINCVYLNKKRCPELRKLLSEKLWIAPSSIRGSSIPHRKIPVSRLQQIWREFLWDYDRRIVLDESLRIFKKKGRTIAGVAKVLQIPLVEYHDPVTAEYLRADRFGSQGFLEEGVSESLIEVCA